MNKKTALFSALLAVTAMTGCSSNDTEPNIGDSYKGVSITVETPVMEDADGGTTRSVYDPDGNRIYWQEGDIIRVYDRNLMLYDAYQFDPAQDAFVCNKAESDISGTISYALSPETLTDFGSWNDGVCTAVMTIPSTYVYDASSEAELGGTRLFAANMPMWGKAGGTFGNVQITLKYLSAILKLRLNGAKGNVTFLKLSASKPVSGAFEAVIARNRVANNDAVLQKGAKSLATKNYIIVDLRQMPQTDAVIYLPLIAGTYSDLTLSYTTKVVAADESLTAASISGEDGTVWTVLKAFAEGKEMKRNVAYVLTRSF